MTDQQRARYVLTRLSNRRYADHPDDRVVPIIEEFAAVRAEAVARERAAICAWLVMRSKQPWAATHRDVIDTLAFQVERGAHEES